MIEIKKISTLFAGNTSKVDYEDLWDGTQASACPIPCTVWSTDTRLLGEYARDNRNTSRINLTFAQKVTRKTRYLIWIFCNYVFPKVRVTTTSYLEFYLSNFFSDLGGSLGLWLGVGILQVLVTQNVIDDSKSTIMIIFKCRYLSSCGKPSQPCPRYVAKKKESNNENFSSNQCLMYDCHSLQFDISKWAG